MRQESPGSRIQGQSGLLTALVSRVTQPVYRVGVSAEGSSGFTRRIRSLCDHLHSVPVAPLLLSAQAEKWSLSCPGQDSLRVSVTALHSPSGTPAPVAREPVREAHY